LNKELAEERFKEITEAYWVLKDPKRRIEYNKTLSFPPKEVEVIYSPPSWKKQEEEWIWDERQLRYRRKWTIKEGEYEARSPHSFKRSGARYRPENLLDKIIRYVTTPFQSLRFWLVRRARIMRLRYRLLLDRIFGKHLYAKQPHKVLKSRST
jgi:curved DNA-binding protein CbpA